MADDKETLIANLRGAGISRAAIDAAWPTWWTDEVSSSASARTELRFTLARRLGLKAKSLLGERVDFIWSDEARFKHLSAERQAEKAALTSYGVAVGRLLVRSTEYRNSIALPNVDALRAAILSSHEYVDLHSLISTAWAFAIPVVHLRVFPLEAKSMYAMVVSIDGRFAILLGRDASYPAPIAFTLAHELGHIFRNHLEGVPALVDMEDPATAVDDDNQEDEADEFALSLLTGVAQPDIQSNVANPSARSLADAVLLEGPRHRIEPGTLALCLAYKQNLWPTANAALRYIYATRKSVWHEVNGIAENEIDWELLGNEGAQFLRKVMGL